ncbi:hypothetical protein BHE74_00058853 [Ensete ventricosum]|nr:hypothetical protein GW17_00018333 [Ensete ventricosum]RWW36142.1 hypothetical protein BHE74_00058853 [Ensete ventricosum]RZS28435.1 hypothetical protein BHM03_00062021 [Ensete ventricosum]
MYLHNASTAAPTSPAVHHLALVEAQAEVRSVSGEDTYWGKGAEGDTYVGGVELNLVVEHNVAEKLLAADRGRLVHRVRPVGSSFRLQSTSKQEE